MEFRPGIPSDTQFNTSDLFLNLYAMGVQNNVLRKHFFKTKKSKANSSGEYVKVGHLIV